MAIYVARSPYRNSSSNRPRLKISFPKIGNLFKRGPSRRARPEVQSASNLSAIHPRRSSEGILTKVRTATLRYEFGPRSVMIGLMMASILLSLLYLIHFNKVATKGYDLNRLDASRQELLGEYDVKNMKLAQIKSLNNIIESGKLEHMRHPQGIVFVRGGTTALASLN